MREREENRQRIIGKETETKAEEKEKRKEN